MQIAKERLLSERKVSFPQLSELSVELEERSPTWVFGKTCPSRGRRDPEHLQMGMQNTWKGRGKQAHFLSKSRHLGREGNTS